MATIITVLPFEKGANRDSNFKFYITKSILHLNPKVIQYLNELKG